MTGNYENNQLNDIFTLSESELSRLSPVVRGCLSLATQAHHLQFRKKENPSIAYIHHPIGALKILQEAGIKDDITLAGALLHDVLEQGPYRYQNHMSEKEVAELGEEEAFRRAVYRAGEGLRSELIGHIKDELLQIDGYDEERAYYIATEIADQIMIPVKQLTNPPIDKTSGNGEHKLFKQVNSAYQYTPRTKRIKMAELGSTLIEDMLYPTTMENDKLRVMHNRALSISELCKDARPELFDMVQELVLLNAAIMDGKSERPDGIDMPRLMRRGERARKAQLRWIKEEQFGDITSGIISVGIDEYGFIAACRVLDDPGEKGRQFGMADDVNRIKSDLANAIGVQTHSRIRINSPSLFDNWQVTRKITFEPAIDLENFIACAKNVDAISDVLSEKLEDQRGQAPLTFIDSLHAVHQSGVIQKDQTWNVDLSRMQVI